MTYLRTEFQKVYYNLDKILVLFFTSFVFMEIAWIPLNSWLAEKLLALTGHAYLSPTNILEVFSENWLVTVGFFLLFIANVLVAYLEMALLFIGINQLMDPKLQDLKDYLSDVKTGFLETAREIRLSKIIFVLFFSVVLFPHMRKVFNIYYFNKIVLPQFIVDYVINQTNLLGIVILLALVLLLFWASTRLMYALPQIYLEHKTVKESIAYSLAKTDGQKQKLAIWGLIRVSLTAFLVFLAISGCLIGWQAVLDFLPDKISGLLAVFNFALIQLAYYGAIAVFLIKFIGLLTEQTLPTYRRKRLRHRFQFSIILLSMLYFTGLGVLYLYAPFDTVPVTISHRGVDNKNGVQNTLPSLEKTAALKPDYIEMDIQETKDKQFVVMHDNDIEALTGFPGGTHDYTLSELTQMTASENGQSAPVPSFDDYLDKADELGQKLIVEIKVNDEDSRDLTKRFLKAYGDRLIKKGHQIQSLDYQTIIEVEQEQEDLITYFILPFNSIYPHTTADGYTMEYTSLDDSFVTRSWFNHKTVYAWTPNDKESMMQMIMLQVDGIITDNLTELNSTVEEIQEDLDYSQLLTLYVQQMIQRF
ncbi:glycerophosphoryl diester phosphodiesterase membrane domain-containing protein [Streptococcus caprae]|uniref:Glycerophosphoryl diester phosphodiesterase membrane domain-containing protein n=1 Tax=Streptococcus caprae TaxID=1640501 RepID=A0ABV8CYQ7_9STRE